MISIGKCVSADVSVMRGDAREREHPPICAGMLCGHHKVHVFLHKEQIRHVLYISSIHFAPLDYLASAPAAR
jgi:hypothetical protein